MFVQLIILVCLLCSYFCCLDCADEQIKYKPAGQYDRNDSRRRGYLSAWIHKASKQWRRCVVAPLIFLVGWVSPSKLCVSEWQNIVLGYSSSTTSLLLHSCSREPKSWYGLAPIILIPDLHLTFLAAGRHTPPLLRRAPLPLPFSGRFESDLELAAT